MHTTAAHAATIRGGEMGSDLGLTVGAAEAMAAAISKRGWGQP